MRVTTIDLYDPPPGELLVWKVSTGGAKPQLSTVPPSFNQAMHLQSGTSGHTWLAAAFDVPGRIDRGALEESFRGLIGRHGTLRTYFTVTDSGISRFTHRYDNLRLHMETLADASTGLAPSGRSSSQRSLRETLWCALNARCDPFAFPAYLLGAIDRDDVSTVICGFDHTHVDAYSISIVIDELDRTYHARRSGVGINDAVLSATTGDFLDFCMEELRSPPTAPTDVRLREWQEFFRSTAGFPPTFPLDLGVKPGESAPQKTLIRTVLDADSTERFAELCRRNGTSVFGGTLAAMAESLRRRGGGTELALLFPMHTRSADRWRNSVGWFTTNAPLRISATGDLVETTRQTGPALRDAFQLATIPMSRVADAIGGLQTERTDVFMVSYVDYQRLPGADRHQTINAHHISNVTRADDVQFWISRTDRGLAIRARYPSTVLARRSVENFVDDLVQSTRDAAHRLTRCRAGVPKPSVRG